MTAQEKIKEAEYNFKKLLSMDPQLEEFQYELSNFLSSTQSIRYHLLEEYNTKFGLNLSHVDSKAFRKKAQKTKNQQAIAFINWYDLQVEQIEKNQTYGHLTIKRHLNIHKENLKPRWFSGIGIIRQTGKDKAELVDYKSLTFFDENVGQQEVRDTCRQFLDRHIQLVTDAHKQF